MTETKAETPATETTGEAPKETPVTKPEPTDKPKKDKPKKEDEKAAKKAAKEAAAKEKVETVTKDQPIRYADRADILIPGKDNGSDGKPAPQWLIDLHGTRIKSALVDGLTESVDKHGVQDPVIVTRDGPNLWIANGVQRVRAVEEANTMRKSDGRPLLKVPYKVLVGLTPSEVFELGVSLNSTRKDDDDLERSSKAGTLVKMAMAEGKNQTQAFAQVADAFGISKSLVENLIKLNSASPKLKQAVREGFLPGTSAMNLAGLPQAEQERLAAEAEKAVLGGGKPMTSAETKSAAKASKGSYKTGKCFAEPALWKAIVKAHVEVGINEMDPACITLLRMVLKQIELADGWNQVKGLRASIRAAIDDNTVG